MKDMPKDKRQMPAWLIGVIIAAVLFVIALVVSAMLGYGDDPVIGGAGERTSADTDGVAVTYLDGTPGGFEDLRGKPLVLNFWASWCPACVAEMPDFEQVHQALGPGVQFIGANTQEISRPDAAALVRQTGVSYPLIDDPDGELYAFFGGISMPTTVFIDSQGNVVDVHSGTIFAPDLENKIREAFGL